MILWRLGETRLSEFVTTLQRTLFWPPVLSCLIGTSPCPTLATYASLCQPGRFINTRWPGYLSCTQITSQVHCRRNCIVPSIIYSQTTSSRNQKTYHTHQLTRTKCSLLSSPQSSLPAVRCFPGRGLCPANKSFSRCSGVCFTCAGSWGSPKPSKYMYIKLSSVYTDIIYSPVKPLL